MILNEYIKDKKLLLFKNIEVRYKHNKVDRDYMINKVEQELYKEVCDLFDAYKIKYHFVKLEDLILKNFTVPVTNNVDNYMTNIYEIESIMIGNQIRNMKNKAKLDITYESKKDLLNNDINDYEEVIDKLRNSKIDLENNFKALALTIGSKYNVRTNEQALMELITKLKNKQNILENLLNKNKASIINNDEDEIIGLYKYLINNTNLDTNEVVKSKQIKL